MNRALLQLRNLRVSFPGSSGRPTVEALRGIDLDLEAGQSVALVGPSGCGKSLTALAACGLLPPNAVWSGRVSWEGRILEDPRSGDWTRLRGGGMTLVLQEPKTSLNPVLRIGDQIAEAIRIHSGLSREQARLEAVALLDEVRISDPAVKAKAYPHELSGGMRQRALLAAALACKPRLLICDEPTTALDPTVQREILILIDRLRRDRSMAMLFITHDRDLVPLMADRVVFMQKGRIESQETVPPPDFACRTENRTRFNRSATPVLLGKGLEYTFATGKKLAGRRPAVDGVDLEMFPGQALGLAGESGCGKTTLARILALHLRPEKGNLILDGLELPNTGPGPSPYLRREIQMIFQDPGQSLNPRQRVGASIIEAASRGEGFQIEDSLAEVDLPLSVRNRYPHELSGGQKQRVALARCLACNPRVLIADEITSALDARTITRVLDLLDRIMAARGLSVLLIDHNLDTLHSFCNRVMVMYRGLVLEIYTPESEDGPLHPYTHNLIGASVRELARDSRPLRTLESNRTTAENLHIAGCPWVSSCPISNDICSKELPPLLSLGGGRYLRCFETGC